MRACEVNAHHEKGCDDGYVAEAVDEEAPAFSESGNDEPRDGRADEARAVCHGRVDGDGIAEIVAIVDHKREERLPAGHVESVDEALKRFRHARQAIVPLA